MKIANIHEAKTKPSASLVEVDETGEKVLIRRHGKPGADLVPHRTRSRLEPLPVMNKIRITYDPIEPLAADIGRQKRET
jgi:antitoxin (DNA-binding transcriptional repressor) of toxin-antitoxin stability system